MSGQILQNDNLRLEVSPSTGDAVVDFYYKNGGVTHPMFRPCKTEVTSGLSPLDTSSFPSMAAGEAYGLQPGHTLIIRRIEGAMLSYHADMDSRTNPYELGLGRLVDLDMDADFVGKAALTEIAAKSIER